MQTVDLTFADSHLTLHNFPDRVVSTLIEYTGEYFSIKPSSLVKQNFRINYVEWRAEQPGFSRVERFFDDDDRQFFAELAVGLDPSCLTISGRIDAPASIRMIARVIRALVATKMFYSGWSFIHAAAVAGGRTCIALTGQKGQGKSTLLLNCLEHSDLRPMTNDKLAVRGVSGVLTAFGFPIRAGIREGTLDRFPDLRRRLANAPRAAANEDKAVRIDMSALATLYKRPLIRSAPISALVMPVAGSDIEDATLTRLSDQEADALLLQNSLLDMQLIEPFQYKVSSFVSALESPPPPAFHLPAYRLAYSSNSSSQAIQALKKLTI
nr:hypothetical protein [uncultured Roseateles sp.]